MRTKSLENSAVTGLLPTATNEYRIDRTFLFYGSKLYLMIALRNDAEWVQTEFKRIGATRKRLRKKITQQNKRASEKYNRQNNLTVKDVYEIIRHNIADNGIVSCIYCDKTLDNRNWTLEHIIPLSKGGSHTIRNIAIACRTCNQDKGSMSFEEFIEDFK